MKIQVKRIYEEVSPEDGQRVLIDRLWPRGFTKEKAKLDAWWKDVAVSHELRKWFHSETREWEDFRQKYLEELEQQKEEIKELIKGLDQQNTITFLYSAKDSENNNAVVLRDFVLGMET